jgi:hypothetical protein
VHLQQGFEVSYATLSANIAEYLHRTDLTTGLISTFVKLAEAKINKVLRVRQMETALASTAINATNEIALPATWVATKVLWADGYEMTPLKPQSLEYIIARDYQSGPPVFYAVKNASWFFDGSGNVSGVYYAGVPSLETNSTNWLETASPDVYLFGALGEAALWSQDDQRMALYATRFDATINELQRNDQRDRLTGPLRSAKR